jgi:UDP-N-acetylmuramoyl-L-alanyl-D-glutamate--2,6-diaminopimelate ligase
MAVLDVDRGLPGLQGVAVRPRPPVPDGPYLVLGTGNAGRAAVTALATRSGESSVLVWDDSTSDEVRLARRALAMRGITSTVDSLSALNHVAAVVKSPGIPMDHPVIAGARRRGMLVIDELELGWRLSSQPVVAVTGTDGKSTTAALVLAAIREAGGRPLLSGNVEGFRGAPAMSAIPPEHDGWIVAEVSSFQAGGCPEFLPSAAVFTNLTAAHLSWHGSMASYGEAKRRLFVRGDRAVSLAVVNVDDVFGRRLAREVSERGGRTLTYGFAADADYRVRGARLWLRGGLAEIDAFGETVSVETRLPGLHNAANAAAAFALSEGLGLARATILDALAKMSPVPGRFEPIDAGQPFDVVVDFAHTPAGVEQMLGTARELVSRRQGRVIAMMGKVGRSYPSYREAIGRAARSGADHLVICGTSLRGEPPLIELSGILAGARQVEGGDIEVVLDRRAAISRSLSRARPGDLVAILGRGGRRRMTYDTKGRPGSFDDRQVARELLGEMGYEPVGEGG